MREFLTYKSGKFCFCHEFNSLELAPSLLRATILNETICDLPILPELASSIEPEIMYSSISATAAIEGNPIPEEDVKLIAEGEDVDGYSKKDKQEILNLIEAYDLLSRIKPSSASFQLTEDLICTLHKLVTHDIPHEHNKPGEYRDGLVRVGDKAHGGVYTPPKIIEDIRNLMEIFIEWINCDDVVDLNPFVRAALAHYYFCIIHPFWDGNGRTARLLETVILETSNVKYVPRELSNYYYKHVDEYYIAFSQSIKLKRDPTPFLAFSLTGAISGLTGIKSSIIRFIRILALKDFYSNLRKKKKLTSRQYGLLSILLDSPTVFTLKDLNTKPLFSALYLRVSTQTARRDLKKLTEARYLAANDEGECSLNMHVLG
ncbi:MAG: Fic family protein [Candidatus Sabulitectum sp.]|nr:Fic family protein [Candidatus Sabulitectum sp.]